jgi:dTDP-4-dehydrorhamnose 3,5-epimerase
VGVELSAENKRQLFIPVGFAHGFCATADVNDVEYKCTEYYMADDQHGVLWSDPTIGVRWPLDKPILSDKDRAYRPLSLAREDLPTYASQP